MHNHTPFIWFARVLSISIGILLAWLLVEVLIRIFFFSLPLTFQQRLRDVRMTPFSDTSILPAPVWQADREYLNINRSVQNYPVHGSPGVSFNASTEILWDTRLAFRTSQEQVKRRVDAVAIGDSYTFCFTELADCWVTQLGEITGRNIINLGIVGTGAVSHQRVLRDFGLPLEPPLVIWQWFGNDANEDYGLARLNGETDTPSPAAPEVRAPNWWSRNSALYGLLDTLLQSEEERAALMWHIPQECTTHENLDLCFGQPYLWDAFDPSLPHNAEGWARSRVALQEAQAMVEGYGGTMLVVLMPTAEQVYPELARPLVGEENMAILQAARREMLALCDALQLHCLDLLPIFQAHAAQGAQLYYRQDLHINAQGNRIMAEAIAAWLAEQFSFPEN